MKSFIRAHVPGLSFLGSGPSVIVYAVMPMFYLARVQRTFICGARLIGKCSETNEQGAADAEKMEWNKWKIAAQMGDIRCYVLTLVSSTIKAEKMCL